MADEEKIPVQQVEPPLSIAQASVDDKGRLKLPSELKAFLETTQTKKFFITTLDKQLGRIYPMELWQQNLQLMQAQKENAKAAERVAFMAKVYGGEAAIDGSGRLLLPTKLRETLGLQEKQPVWLDVYKGRVTLLTQSVYDERMAAIESHNEADLEVLEAEGLF
jgi:DNA-binding transcriptional regulator/RsmH inhibitor MraZ